MHVRLIAITLILLALALAPSSLVAQAQGCGTARSLCPNPNMCFMNVAAEQAWADANNCTFITQEMLDQVNPGHPNRNRELVGMMNRFARAYGVESASQIAHMLSQMAHESALDPLRPELLSYRPVQMRRTFGCVGGSKNYNEVADDCTRGRLRPKLWTQEANYARNSRNLANYVYADRLGNGNEASGDGYAFRGRGPLQLTGRTNYQNFQDHWNRTNPHDQRDLVSNPDSLFSDSEYAMASSFYWWMENANRTADGGTVCRVTCRVNGGENGFADRQTRYNAVACTLGLAQDSGGCRC